MRRKSAKRWANLVCSATSCGYAIIIAAPAQATEYKGAVLYSLTAPAADASSFFVPTDAVAGQAVGYFVSPPANAVAWSSPLGSSGILPVQNGVSAALVNATDGTQQVGQGNVSSSGFVYNALLWSGSAAPAVDLNPTGFTQSFGEGISGSQQVGDGFGKATNNNSHALLWTGSASSAVDLNPAGFIVSEAFGTNGTEQVGFGTPTPDFNSDVNRIFHALMWSDTAASVVDLGTDGFTASVASGIDPNGTQEVGGALSYSNNITNPPSQAMLWDNTAASAVDLSPDPLSTSVALATNGNIQVGSINNDATLWSGSAASAVNLNALLPSSDTWTTSTATSIDSAGNIYGYAEDADGKYSAVEWSAVPEPAPAALLALGAMCMITRRTRGVCHNA